MASNINPNTISTTFPVAGQDNDTQGFRDNFSAIVTAFTTASQEISNLQANAVLNTQNNNFNSNEIQNAVLRDVGYRVNSTTASGAVSGPVSISYLQGAYQIYNIQPGNTATIFSVDSNTWPTNGVSWTSLKVQASSSDSTSSVTVSFINPPADSSSTYVLYVDKSITNPYTITTASTAIFEISTPDGGLTQFLTGIQYSV